MRNVLCLVLLVPVLVLAAGTTKPATKVAPGVSLRSLTALPGDGQAGPVSPRSGSGTVREARFTIGVVDTVGGTTYDWQSNGPDYRWLTQTPGKGAHVIWMYSAEMTSTTFPDRRVRYNYYDYGNRSWTWMDPDFMQRGAVVFAERTGYATIDIDTNGVEVIVGHHSTGAGENDIAPILARDADIGVGIFDYKYGEPTINYYVWPALGINTNGYYQLAMIDATNDNNLYRGRSTDQGATWDAAVGVPSPQPEPLFPTHGIATSKVPGSNKVAISWVATVASGYQQDPAFYRESPDGGNTWNPPVDIGFPPAYNPGSETVPSFHSASLFPLYDKEDHLHIVGTVQPYVRDTNWVLPGQLWHWCADNPDTWTLIHIASPDSWMAPIGYNAMICDRPTLGEDASGNLFVAWEEFDGVNIEPGPPERLRADIWYSYSTDKGELWADAVKLTDGGSVTYRFPSIMNPIRDTVMVEYLIDQIAGFFIYGGAEGAATNNPIVVQKWENPAPQGVEGPKTAPPGRIEVAASPSPARGRTAFSYALQRSGDVSLVVYDAAGRPVRNLASGHREAGRYTATWDAEDVAAGVYFYTLTSGKAAITRKLVLAN